MIKLIRKAGKPILEKVKLIDRFEGGKIDENKCSKAYRLWYRDKKRILNDSDIKTTHENIRRILVNELEAELRS